MGRQPQCPLNTGERSTSGQRFEKSVLRGLTLSFSISKLPPKSVLGEIALIRLGMVRPDSGRTGDAEVTELSGRRRRACTLASVRRPNCTCGFPACSFHEDSTTRGRKEGINPTRFTSLYSPKSVAVGSC